MFQNFKIQLLLSFNLASLTFNNNLLIAWKYFNLSKVKALVSKSNQPGSRWRDKVTWNFSSAGPDFRFGVWRGSTGFCPQSLCGLSSSFGASTQLPPVVLISLAVRGQWDWFAHFMLALPADENLSHLINEINGQIPYVMELRDS